MHKIGIMQGRLLPKVDGRIQAFPRDRWREEFALSKELGYQGIELTIEMASWESHPIRTAAGRAEQARLAADADQTLMGLCCDVFMERPLISADAEIRTFAMNMLRTLITDGADAGLPMIEIPMMGDASLKPAEARDAFSAVLETIAPVVETTGIRLLMETDLPPSELVPFLARNAMPWFGVNYDMGNSTWFGYIPEDEIPVYAPRIGNVHVKDCTRKDYSVPLGSGETRIADVMTLLAQAGYEGDFVLQAARQQDDLAAAGDYLNTTLGHVRNAWPHG